MRWQTDGSVARLPLAYEVSAYEMASHLTAGPLPWGPQELQSELAQRVAFEKGRRELHVPYYRIGHTLSFPLPLAYRPAELPPGIPGTAYPWLTWLAWELDERWRILHVAWRRLADARAAELLQAELAALAGWETFVGEGERVSLVTGHLAGCLALALANSEGWDQEAYRLASSAGQRLVEEDLWPWCEKHWPPERALRPPDLHNIPFIALVRGAQLARVLASPAADDLERRARRAVLAWWRYRLGPERQTEGPAYDGYLLDAVTAWLAGLPPVERAELLAQGHDAFADVVRAWWHLSLPGRPDLLAPLGDVEPEMPFYATVLCRLARWYGWGEADWFLRRFPLSRLPAAALSALLKQVPTAGPEGGPPSADPLEHASAVSLRSGWDLDDLLVAVGASRGWSGHLHCDGGHVVIGWHGRFWVTDPGYQQYHPGPEREYTLGPQAHNGPVIGDAAQVRRAVRVLALEGRAGQSQHVALDLTACYDGLPASASVRRDVWLLPEGGRAVVVRDLVRGCPPGIEVHTHWHSGTHLAWAFRDGWGRLSDGERALWIGTYPGHVSPDALKRHVGSRGPLTLTHGWTLQSSRESHWWVFCCDPALSWSPPEVNVAGNRLVLHSPNGGEGWEIHASP